MKYKILGISVIVIVIVLLALLYPKKQGQISIGAIIPQTGFGAYWGSPVLKGIAMAETELKKLYGAENVIVKVEDSQSSATAAVSAAKKLLEIDGVDAIYTEFSGPGSAVSPVVQAKNKTHIYSAFNEKILETNPYSIKTFVSFEVACEKFAKTLDASKKILIIATFPDGGPYCVKGLSTVIPASNIKDIEGFQGTDFRTVLLQNKSFDPDYIIGLMYEDGAYSLYKQTNELGMRAKLFCHKQDCMTEKNLAALPASYTRGSVYFDSPITQSFQARAHALYPDVTEDEMQGIGNAYQTVMLAGVGLAACPDKSPSCVTKAISEITNPDYFAYERGRVVNRMLRSEMEIGYIK